MPSKCTHAHEPLQILLSHWPSGAKGHASCLRPRPWLLRAHGRPRLLLLGQRGDGARAPLSQPRAEPRKTCARISCPCLPRPHCAVLRKLHLVSPPASCDVLRLRCVVFEMHWRGRATHHYVQIKKATAHVTCW